MTTLANLIGDASFAATVTMLAMACVAEIRARLDTPTHGDFSRL